MFNQISQDFIIDKKLRVISEVEMSIFLKNTRVTVVKLVLSNVHKNIAMDVMLNTELEKENLWWNSWCIV